MSEEQIDEFLKLIYTGVIGITTPSEAQKFYEFTFLNLFSGVQSGYGIEQSATEVVKQLEQNINIFSGAKTWKNIYDVQTKILD